MDKRFISLLAFSLAAVPSLAVADGGGWYAAADLGQSHYSEGIVAPLGPCSITNCTTLISVNHTGTGYRLSGGYQFDDHWGLEAGYADLGHASDTICIECGTVIVSFLETIQVKTHGWVLDGTGTLPINEAWSLTGRLGMIDAHVEPRVTGFGSGNFSATRWRWTLGGSLNWALTGNWGLRLNFDHFRRLGDSNATGQFSVNLFTLGVVYRFR